MPLENTGAEPSLGQSLVHGATEGLGTVSGVFGGGALGGRLGAYAGAGLAGRASYRDYLRNRHAVRGSHLAGAGLMEGLARKGYTGLTPQNVIARLRNTVLPESLFTGKAPGASSPSTALSSSLSAIPSPKGQLENLSRNAGRLGFERLKPMARQFAKADTRFTHTLRKALGGGLGSALGGIAGMIGGGMLGNSAGDSLGNRLAGLSKTSNEKTAIVGLMRGLGQAARTGFNAMRGAAKPMAAAAPKTMPVQGAVGQWANGPVKQVTLPSGPWSNPVPRPPAPAPTMMQTAGQMAGQVGAGIKSDMSAMSGGVGRAIGYGAPIAGAGYMMANSQGAPQQPMGPNPAQMAQNGPQIAQPPPTQLAAANMGPEQQELNPAQDEASLVAGGP